MDMVKLTVGFFIATCTRVAVLACGGSTETVDAGEDTAPPVQTEVVCAVGDAGHPCNGGNGFAFFESDNTPPLNCIGPASACQVGQKCVLIDQVTGAPMTDGGVGSCMR